MIRSMRLPLALSMMLGLIANFLVYWPDANTATGSASPWRDLPAISSVAKPASSRLGVLLGLQPAEASGNSSVPQQAEPQDERFFAIGGEVYRLTGLVTGNFPAATISTEAGATTRMQSGDSLPSGEIVQTIGINELEILKNDGEIEIVAIYKR